ncbi:hypothetical protein IFO69_10675 [Echinicola sp. CAU 1574]|uniref:DUF6973 domain-containing protein n=1 Tax=Echinicola arenosa TaxID=2774144 RepID=A0ABR9AK69_9BACT|nr:hypothetical protein [Echinicola arenosa]MBD8489209.1 hypothetical protein [Echinicola arenosa]
MNTKDKLLSIIIMVVFILSFSCSSDDPSPKPISNEDPVGPISGEDFKSVPIPTYDLVIEAYENISNTSPNLLEEESDQLSIALFEEIKKLSNKASTNNDRLLYESLSDKLTEEEWKLVLTNPYKSFLAFLTLKPSFDDSGSSFSCDPNLSLKDTKVDAIRHAYWNALMTQKISDMTFIEELTNAHESNSDSEDAKLMDLHNNKIGRELALQYPTATADELLTILLQYDFLFVGIGQTIPETYQGLVYIEGKKIFDIKMKGSLSNPDSGGPWDIEFDIYECGNTIRGNFTIIRGAERQDRRFSGTMVDGLMQLEVSNPLVFENPRGLYACTGMRMNLTGNEKSLEGRWTSSNCYRGGTVLLSNEN